MSWDPIDPFDDYFKRMMKKLFKDLEEMEKEFEYFKIKPGKEKMPEFTIKRPGRVEKKGGFSISISSNGKNPPKIDVRRFGPSGKWEKVPIEKREAPPIFREPPEMPEEEPEVEFPMPEVKEKEIPEYNVSVDIKEVTITLKAEGVEKKENVKVKFYPESVEIYAASPKLDKGYFCTVAIPAKVDKNRAKVEVEKDRVIIKIPRRISAF